METETIYVKLLEENVDVWRPIKAKRLDGDIYLIIEQPYDRDDELWEFEPGERVLGKIIRLSEGSVLVAYKAPEQV